MSTSDTHTHEACREAIKGKKQSFNHASWLNSVDNGLSFNSCETFLFLYTKKASLLFFFFFFFLQEEHIFQVFTGTLTPPTSPSSHSPFIFSHQIIGKLFSSIFQSINVLLIQPEAN